MSEIKKIIAYKYIVSVYGKAPWKSKLPTLLFTDDFTDEETAKRVAENYVLCEATIYGVPLRAVVSRATIETSFENLQEYRRPLQTIIGGKNEEDHGMS